MDDEYAVPWPRVAAFICQHTHDMRNHLNALDLEAALLRDLVTDARALESVDNMRAQIRVVATGLRELSLKMSEASPNRGVMLARDLLQIWQEQARALGMAERVAWNWQLGEERVDVDAAGVSKALRELLVNARQFGGDEKIVGAATVKDGWVAFELREEKSKAVDPADWGGNPLRTTRRGGYGLGLWEAERLVEASGGEVERLVRDGATVVTRFCFPVAAAAAAVAHRGA